MKKSMLVILLLSGMLAAYGQQQTVNVPNPGGLKDLVTDQISAATDLKVTGKLDYSDFQVIQAFTNLVSLDLSGVTEIAEFVEVGEWIETTHPAGKVPNRGLKGLVKLTTLKLPTHSSITTLGSIFEGTSITAIEFPSNITTIGGYAFSGSAFETLTIPATVTTLEEGAFGNAKNLASVTLHDGITELPGFLFQNSSALEEIVWPTNLKTIGRGAFNGTGFAELEIPKTVETIGQYAFENTEKLESLTFEAGSRLKTIGKRAFQYSTLQHIDIPEGVTAIGESAFSWSGLKSFTLPSTVTVLENSLFAGSKGLEGVEYTLPAHLTKIGNSVFEDTGLKFDVVEIPATIVSVGARAFAGTTINTFKLQQNTTEFINPESSGNAYKGGLNEATVNKVDLSGRENLPDFFFWRATVNEIVYGENLKSIGEGAFSGSNIKEVTLPATVESVGGGVFYGFQGETVDISKISLKEIVNSNLPFFSSSQVKTIKLPATLATIPSYTFFDSPNIISLYLGNSTPATLKGEFYENFSEDIKDKATLYVPKGSEEAYRKANIWKEFAKIEGYSDKEAQTVKDLADRLADVEDVIELPAKTDQGLDVTYTIEEGKTDVATLSGNKLTVTGAGEVKVTATQAGNDQYAAFSKTITIATSFDYSWLQAPAISVEGNTVKVVGTDKPEEFEITIDGVKGFDLSGKTGDAIKLEATNDTQKIRLIIKR